MTIRVRKFVGTFALFALAIVWTLLGMALAQSILLSTNSLLAWVYYIVVGIGWALPAMPLVKWMSKPDPEKVKPR
ncbi:MAG: DUF2842 domain-containing protein [Pseudolabrys sp.]|nr:DUF2842 domain-containing protein [Pseudolabrys sp.]MBV9262325.1 DUF2842 domain-containing protein [Pseudolabrys sp.]